MSTAGADDLVNKMWATGNVITAFTVIQSLTVIYFALEKVELVKPWLGYAWIAPLLILAGSGAYMTGVWKCYLAEKRLRIILDHSVLVLETSWLFAMGRIVTILIFNCLAAAASILAVALVC